MASSNELASIDSFHAFPHLQSDFWTANHHTTDSFSKFLIESLYTNNNNNSNNDQLDSDFNQLLHAAPDHHTNNNNNSFTPNFDDLPKPDSITTATPTLSNVSASDPEISTTTITTTATPKQRLVTAKGRITKRKSRATKKNQTTFITADPANFRQMVQQVTGIRFDNSSSSSAAQLPLANLLLKPEPLRPMASRLYSSCLPTLDTSSFLLDRQMQQQGQSLTGESSIYAGTGLTAAYGGGEDGGVGGGYGANFPTLESWKVM